jgi:tripartite-type tricarboxylate transporter receptor subunit TctC
MKRLMRVTVLCLFFLGSLVLNLSAQGLEKYPSKPISLVNAYVAGGTTYLGSTILSAIAPKYFGQPVITTPKPGGNGLVALQYVLSSKPDGYTLYLGKTGEMSVAPLIENMPFDVVEEFIPIAQFAIEPMVVAVSTKYGWKTIEDLIAAAKKEPMKITYGTPSSYASTRFMLEQFNSAVGIKMTCVPFKGDGPASIAVAGGHVAVYPGGLSNVLPHIQRGDMRVLLIFGDNRLKEYPDVPTAKEKGIDINMKVWFTVFATKDTPQVIRDRVQGFLKKLTEDKEFIEKNALQVREAKFLTGNDFAKQWKKERDMAKEIIKQLGFESFKK